MGLNTTARKQATEILLNGSGTDEAVLFQALRMLAKYRSTLVQNTLIARLGAVVFSGPFQGMTLFNKAAEGCYVPKWLGCYEEELHPFLSTLPEQHYDVILNIGCAEGYYAVGIKKLVPQVEMHAFDTNPVAQKACLSFAQMNNVELSTIGGEFSPANFAQYADRKTLVWCDIEGAEEILLDPDKTPSLQYMDLVVETHRIGGGHTLALMQKRFEKTHAIETLMPSLHNPKLPKVLEDLSSLDHLLAVWEWRSHQTPWVIMRSLMRAQ